MFLLIKESNFIIFLDTNELKLENENDLIVDLYNIEKNETFSRLYCMF